MSRFKRVRVFTCSVFLLTSITVLAATGSRLESATPAGFTYVINGHSEVEEVRRLLQNNLVESAVLKAREFVKRQEQVRDRDSRVQLYYGLNALCGALTAADSLAEAVTNCDRAIELDPDRWQAFNNRGTAYFQQGNYDMALSDYRQALSMTGDSEQATRIVQHNIGLVEEKKNDPPGSNPVTYSTTDSPGPVSPITLMFSADRSQEDPVIQEVLKLREQGLRDLITGNAGTEADYSSTFVANTPDRGVLQREALLPFFTSGAVSYDDVHQTIEYAAMHGTDIVVLMGEEVVVPGAGLTDAGRHVHRRFTDIFRYENGSWRHDLRHANVTRVD